MSWSTAARTGIWLSIYAWGGSLVGVLGFGLLWRGLSHLQWIEAIMGLGLLLLGLDRASVAFKASMRSRDARRTRREPHQG